jgi:hypothetical protein
MYARWAVFTRCSVCRHRQDGLQLVGEVLARLAHCLHTTSYESDVLWIPRQMVSWLVCALVAAVLPMAMGQSGPAAPTLHQISNGTSSWIIQSSGLPGAGAVL